MFTSGRVSWLVDGDGVYEIIGLIAERRGMPIGELLAPFNRQQVWCNYAFSREPLTPPAILKAALDAADGLTTAEYEVHWSELTGYLWTDHTGMVGGHNLLAIFEQHIGEYGCLIVETHPINLEDYL